MQTLNGSKQNKTPNHCNYWKGVKPSLIGDKQGVADIWHHIQACYRNVMRETRGGEGFVVNPPLEPLGRNNAGAETARTLIMGRLVIRNGNLRVGTHLALTLTEFGGKMTHAAEPMARIVCGPNGERLKPFAKAEKKGDPCGEVIHFGMRPDQNFCIVTVAGHEGNEQVTVHRLSFSRKDAEIRVEGTLLVDPSRFAAAVAAAKRKFNCFHCTEPHYALGVEEHNVHQEIAKKPGHRFRRAPGRNGGQCQFPYCNLGRSAHN